MSISSVTVQVPASTSNLGPGFDTLGLALQLHNQITVTREAQVGSKLNLMLTEAAHYFFQTTSIAPFPFSTKIAGDIPISRGLGSSVTVRLGLLFGLAELAADAGGPTLSRDELLQMVIALEGHPDNAVASCCGGFAVCSSSSVKNPTYTRVEVGAQLSCIALIPNLELSTEKARRLLPEQIPFSQAVANIQNTARLAALMVLQDYAQLAGLFGDNLHQPFRKVLIPGFEAILEAATEAGALGSFLSGAGSTLLALTLTREKEIAIAMLKTAQAHGLPAQTIILKPDNVGAQIIARN